VKPGQLWTYTRDGRLWTVAIPGAVYQIASGRSTEHGEARLAGFTGILLGDGCVSFKELAATGTIAIPALQPRASCFSWKHTAAQSKSVSEILF
jgi:hypothetical protein